MPSGDGYHVITAILSLLYEPPKDEPAQLHGVANGFSNRSDGRPVSEVQPNSFRRRRRAAEKLSIGCTSLSRRLKGRSLRSHLETQRFCRRSGACISKIMRFARRFREALASHKGAGWFAIHLQHDRAL
jgi:hypothetical protein